MHQAMLQLNYHFTLIVYHLDESNSFNLRQKHSSARAELSLKWTTPPCHLGFFLLSF